MVENNDVLAGLQSRVETHKRNKRIWHREQTGEIVLGGGGFSKVTEGVLVSDDGAELPVAIKYFLTHVSPGWFTREARICETLPENPRHLTRYIGSNDSGEPFIVLEKFGDGSTLNNYKEGELGKKSLDRTLRFLAQIVVALEEVYASGYSHFGDLKFGNCLIDQQADPKYNLRLTDFSHVGLQPGEMSSDSFSPRYAAPDWVFNSKLDGRVDVFAFGVMTYELLTGMHPYIHSQARGADEYVANCEGLYHPIVIHSKELSEEDRHAIQNQLNEVFYKAVNPYSDYRYANCRIFFKELVQCLRRIPNECPYTLGSV